MKQQTEEAAAPAPGGAAERSAEPPRRASAGTQTDRGRGRGRGRGRRWKHLLIAVVGAGRKRPAYAEGDSDGGSGSGSGSDGDGSGSEGSGGEGSGSDGSGSGSDGSGSGSDGDGSGSDGDGSGSDGDGSGSDGDGSDAEGSETGGGAGGSEGGGSETGGGAGGSEGSGGGRRCCGGAPEPARAPRRSDRLAKRKAPGGGGGGAGGGGGGAGEAQEPAPRGPPENQRNKRPRNLAARDYDDRHLSYYRGLSAEARAGVDEAEAAVLSRDGACQVPARFRLLACGAPPDVKAHVLHFCQPAFHKDACGSERAKSRKWLDAFLRIPFGVFKPAPVSSSDDPGTVRRFLDDVRGRLHARIYGHAEAKEQVVSTLAKWISNPGSRGNVLGIHGPMGCGKTTLVKHCIAEALGLPMVSVSLGGTGDASVFTGHHVTYEGSTHGLVAGALMKAGCMNPVILFDELDKLSECERGREVAGVLIHLTDATQNDSFQDHYFANVPLDLSRAIMVFTYNSPEAVNPILLDRMTRIETHGYCLKDKQAIASEHLLPAACREYGFAPGAITISPETVAAVVSRVGREGGVRNLQRGIASIVSGLNMRRLIGEDLGEPAEITQEAVREFVKDDARARNPSLDHLYT